MEEPQNFSELKIKNEIIELLNKNSFIKMKPVQSQTICEFLKHDVVVQSQTGSGKTLAYLIPIFNKILEERKANSPIKAIIIVPTRELALQIQEIINLFEIKSSILIGGFPIEEDLKKLINTEVVVATPGRLFEIVQEKKALFSRIKYLVIDECDRLFSFDFEVKITNIIKMLPKSRITGLFSATIDENVDKLSSLCCINPVTIKVNDSLPDKLILEYKILSPQNKINDLLEITKDKRCIVFFSTCNCVDFFYELLRSKIKVHKIHGKLDQKERSLIYKKFEEEGGVLLCTDVAARGIDFKLINLVIHFDVPKDYNNIVHRSGRTARNNSFGRSVIYLMKNEKAYIQFLRLKKIETTESTLCANTDYSSELKALMTPELLSLSVKAFVSYVRGYKEHIVNYILNYKEINYDELVQIFFLEKIPQMVELKNVRFKEYERPGIKRVKR